MTTLATRLVVLDGVLEKIREQPEEAFGIAGHHRRVSRNQLDRDLLRRSLPRHELDRLPGDVAQIDRLECLEGLFALETGERQQVCEQCRQPPALLDDPLTESQGGIAILQGAVAERLGVALDCRERSAQLVRDVGDEVAAHPVQLLRRRDVAHHDDGSLLRAERRAGERQRAADRLHPFEVQVALGAVGEHLLDEIDQPRLTGEIEHIGRRGVRRHAEDLAEGGVQKPDSAAGVGHQHTLDHSRHRGAQVIALRLDRAKLLVGVARDALQASCRGAPARAVPGCGWGRCSRRGP